MATRTIGLDIGTHAVRAVEVAFGRGRPVLQRFGQVALPVGAVSGGEVADPPAVAAALRRLWREAGFRGKRVVIGVANQRVVARSADVPDMPEAELRSALRFQVQDLIPMPVDEAVLDYQIVERVVGPDQQEQLRILLVAAHEEMLRSVLAALEGAGLSALRVDLVPFALVRALHEDVGFAADFDEEPVGEEAIVGVGAGVTNIVVHEHGLARFVRTLTIGGDGVVDAIASELDVDVDVAEDLKRRADSLSPDPDVARAAQVVAASLSPLIEEIRTSLEFHLSQSDGRPLRRVVLSGGGSRLADFEERLADVLGVPVVRGRPLDAVEIGQTGIADDVIAASSDLLAVPLGLALSGEPGAAELRRVSLLPVAVGARQEERRQLVVAGTAVAGFAALLLVLFLLRNGQVEDAREDARQEEARTAELEGQIASLQDVAALETTIAERRQTVLAVLDGDVAWTRLLQEIATVIPNDVWLTSFQGTRGGAVQVSGMGFDQTSAARWLLRVGELDALTGLWLPSSTKSEGGLGPDLITFSSNANLTPAAGSDRAERFGGSA